MAKDNNPLQELHNLLIKENEVIFSEKKSEMDFFEFIMSLQEKETDELINMIGDSDFKDQLENYGQDEYSPIGEFLVYLAESNPDIENKPEYKLLTNEERPIWHLEPSKIAQFFKDLGIGFSELARRINNQYIFHSSLGTVMARADGKTNQNDFFDATLEFAQKKEEHKRETFIKVLEQHFK